ncbi:hypothetical protein V8E53_011554 [Lactarius tabidus]
MQSQIEAKFASMNLKSPGLKYNVPSSPSTCSFNTSVMNCQSLPFNSSFSFHLLPSANSVGNPSDAATTSLNSASNSKPPATPRIVYPHQLSPQAQQNRSASVHSARSRNAITPPHKIFPSSLGLPIIEHRLGPLQQPSVPLFPPRWRSLSQSSTANNNPTGHGQTVDLAAAKLNDLFGSGSFPRLDGLEKSSAGPVVSHCLFERQQWQPAEWQ